MLGQRVITALLLLAALVGAVRFGGLVGFEAITLVLLAAGLWEWSRLVGLASRKCIAVGLISLPVLVLADIWVRSAPQVLEALLIVAALVWLVLLAGLVSRRQFPNWVYRPGFGLGLGFLACGVCWLALMDAYRVGLVFLTSVLAIVWVADIAAYFVGRAFGRHKLAPSISPGKTIEGAIGGLACVWLVAYGAQHVPDLERSIVARLSDRWPAAGVAIALAVLVGFSICGDLFESALKRRAGRKDSSALLPGHGGVLDRIDALLPVVPWALLLTRNW